MDALHGPVAPTNNCAATNQPDNFCSRRPSTPPDENLALIGQGLLRQWILQRDAEREIVARESHIQTTLARRRWGELQGLLSAKLRQPTQNGQATPSVPVPVGFRERPGAAGKAVKKKLQSKTPLPRQGPSNGGRPKDPGVLQFEEDIQYVITSGLKDLRRNGVNRRNALEQIKAWTKADIVRRVNEERNRNHPLHGRQGDAIRKQVERAPAYRQLRELTWDSASHPEDPDSQAIERRDRHWASENGLHTPR